MAYEILGTGDLVTLRASTTLAAHQYKFVINTGASGAALPGTAGISVFGVLQNKPGDDEAGTIAISGVSKVKATASTLAQGDLCAASSAGFAIPAGAGNYVVGRVVEGSSGSTGRVLSVLIQPIGTT